MSDDYRIGNTGTSHHCSWPGCKMRVPAQLWGCRAHWYRIPPLLRAALYKAFVPGQAVVDWSPAYRAASEAVDAWIAQQPGVARPLRTGEAP